MHRLRSSLVRDSGVVFSPDAMPRQGTDLRDMDPVLRNLLLQQERFTRLALLKLLPVADEK
jgi:hypothetical protein